jgi:hypothetical protein
MDKSTKINKAILEINSDAKFIIRGATPDTVTIAGVEWLEGTTPISTSDIETKMAEVQAAYDAQEYARSRALEYPSIGDQLDMIYHNGDGGATFQAAIKAVKDKYPKE